MSALRACLVVAATTAACGDSASTPEVVVPDASLGGAPPQVLGATATTVFWTASTGATSTLVGGASLASLPATGMQLVTATGPVAQAGDSVAFAADGVISRVDLTGTSQRATVGTPDVIARSSASLAFTAWTTGSTVSWGADVQMTATLTKIDRCDHGVVTPFQIYVAADGATGRRLLRIDQRSGGVMPMTASVTWAPMFPGGGIAGSTYRGRIVDADDDGALWLVEEMPSQRGILVREPVQGDPTVLLEHVSGATGFFASADALYWQEGAELLTAPRAGGSAQIVASLPGPAGALADGYVYFTNGAAIERLRLE